LASRAQQPNTPLIGFLNVASSNEYRPQAAAFRQGLQETGYVEGQNVAIEFRWAEGQSDRLPVMVDDLLHRQVAVIGASLNRPGGNVTGVTQLTSGLVAKKLEVLHELLPTAKTVALLVKRPIQVNSEVQIRETTSAAQMLGLELHVLEVSTEE